MQAAIVLPAAAQCLKQIHLRERSLPVRLTLTGAAAVAGLHGMEVFDFSLILILLGLGSNFGFLGASALVLKCHGNVDKRRVQAFNYFLIFAVRRSARSCQDGSWRAMAGMLSCGLRSSHWRWPWLLCWEPPGAARGSGADSAA